LSGLFYLRRKTVFVLEIHTPRSKWIAGYFAKKESAEYWKKVYINQVKTGYRHKSTEIVIKQREISE
jgi:hypothetical protein